MKSNSLVVCFCIRISKTRCRKSRNWGLNDLIRYLQLREFLCSSFSADGTDFRILVQSLILDKFCRLSRKYKTCLRKPTDKLWVIWWLQHQLWLANPPIWRMLQGTSVSFWQAYLMFLVLFCEWQLKFLRHVLLLMFRVLLRTKYRRLPVVDDDGRLVRTWNSFS